MTADALRRSVVLSVLTGAGAALLVTTGTSGSAASPAARDDSGVTTVRNATERFHDVDVALAAGYLPTDDCVQLPGTGAMGLHYLHPELASDHRLVPTQPEVLLYELTEHGPVLVGVEYFVAEQAVRGATPSVLGRQLNGPMAGHTPGMPTHYDLHLWVWRDNPQGLTADYNPAVSCPHE